MRKIGVYVDASNIAMNGGYGMRYDALREFACRAGGEAQRLNAYIAFDDERAGRDRDYANRTYAYHSVLRSHGYRLSVKKKTKRYTDEEGIVHLKANTDLDMAVDVLTESDKLDTVLLVTGDGDFARVVTALQSKGCRVEVLAFDNISRELREQADTFINGYSLPGLLPTRLAEPGAGRHAVAWGALGSRVRGYCTRYDTQNGYGFISYYAEMPDSLILSTSPVAIAYMRKSDLVDTGLPVAFPPGIFAWNSIWRSRGGLPMVRLTAILKRGASKL